MCGPSAAGHYSSRMRLYGRVWFDFSNPQVWQFYRFVRAFAKAGNVAELDWVPFYRGTETEAMVTYAGLTSPQERGLFLHALLGLVYLEGRDPEDHTTVERAKRAAAIPDDRTPVEEETLEAMARAARELGVEATPSLYQHGPILHVVLNGAASSGPVELTAQTITAVLSDDGIWSLTKPSPS